MNRTETFKFHFKKGRWGQKKLMEGTPVIPPGTARGRLPRISRLVALAFHIEKKLKEGAYKNMAELAKEGNVSRTRISQIMNLLNLAPEIQAALLFLPKSGPGPDPVTERDVRPIAAETCWDQQRRLWRELRC